MPDDIYLKLRESIDNVGNGFPATKNDADVRLLKKVFNEEDAKTYMILTEKLETPEAIAKRTGEDPGKLAEILERMRRKGLAYFGQKGQMRYYAAVPFAQGFLEHHVDRLDKEYVSLIHAYFQAEKVEDEFVRRAVPMRPIPVNEAIIPDKVVAPHDDIKELLKQQDRIAVARCFCASQRRVVDPQCDQPLEVCFFVNFHADYYVDNGWARYVNYEEAIEIFDKARDFGLVCQPINGKIPGAICNCCPDCCIPFQVTKTHPKPADWVISHYYCQADHEICVACGECFDRCPTDALTPDAADKPIVNLDRCIGCGLCTAICSTEALSLKAKPIEEWKEPPEKTPFMKSSDEFESEMT